MDPKFQVEIFGSHSRTFHTNVEVGKNPIERYSRSSSWSQISRVQGRIVADMVTEILHVKDVESVVESIFIHPYEVSVHLDTIHNANPRWNEKIDRIVHDAFKRLAGLPQPCNKVLIHNNVRTTREFSTNFEISKAQTRDFWRPLRDSSEEHLTEIGLDGAKLVRKLMDIPGVTEIWIHPYQVTVKIGKAFDWVERDGSGINLEDKIEKIFEDVFGDILFTQN